MPTQSQPYLEVSRLSHRSPVRSVGLFSVALVVAFAAAACSRPITNPFEVIDTDRDGVVDADDNCFRANPDQLDSDGDGIGDICDPDFDLDEDTVHNQEDNCLSLPNTDQANYDDDEFGDVCDDDDDADGFTDAEERLAGTDSKSEVSTPNQCATDSDCARYNTETDNFACDRGALLCFLSNTPPLARPGPDQIVEPGWLVRLDATASTDSEQNPLTFEWKERTAWGIELSDPTVATPTFIAPDVDNLDRQVDTIVIELKALDRTTVSDIVATRIIVNRPPVVDPGPTLSVGRGQNVSLDGSSTMDPDGDPNLTYVWEQISGEPVTVFSADQPVAQFNSPTNWMGFLEFQLTVTDGVRRTDDRGNNLDEGTSQKTLLVEVINTAPTAIPTMASAGSPRTTSRTLDGQGSSDPEGDALTHVWTLTRRADGATIPLSPSTTSATPSFVADQTGWYDATLVVRDGLLSSPVANYPFEITNQAPTAVVELVISSTSVGENVQLSAAGSSDPDDDRLSYSFRLVSKPGTSTLSDDPFDTSTDPIQPTFVPDRKGTYVIGVVANDGYADSNEATVQVSVSSDPFDMDIISGDDQLVYVGRDYDEPLVAQVTNEFGTPVRNAPIVFAIRSGTAKLSGGLSSTTVNSDTAGLAQVTLATAEVLGQTIIDAWPVGYPQMTPATFTVGVLPAVTAVPGAAVVVPGEFLAIQAEGGSGDVTMELVQNQSGAAFDYQSGALTAGYTPGGSVGTVDIVRITDNVFGDVAEARITVGTLISSQTIADDSFANDFLVVEAGATLVVDSSAAPRSFRGLRVRAGGTVTTVAPGAAGFSTLDLTVEELVIDPGAAIHVDGLGYDACLTIGNGPEGAPSDGGGSHGGAGNAFSGPAGIVYDLANNPTLPGGGGCGTGRGRGGGVLHLAADSANINGEVTAHGAGTSRGGAGGSIMLEVGTLSGVGTVAANGPATADTRGGGGRVAVISTGLSSFAGTFEAHGSPSTATSAGAPGTVHFADAPGEPGRLVIDNGGGELSRNNPARRRLSPHSDRGRAQSHDGREQPAGGQRRLDVVGSHFPGRPG